MAAAVACLFLSRLSVPEPEKPLWKSYHPLLVVNTIPEKKVVEYFTVKGFSVESLSSVKVFLHDYPGVALHSYSAIMTSLPSEDPRQDPVFERITPFYTHYSDGRYWNIFYIKTDDLGSVYTLASESGLTEREFWYLPEYVPPAEKKDVMLFRLFLLCMLGAALFSGPVIPVSGALVLILSSGLPYMLHADYLPLVIFLSIFSLIWFFNRKSQLALMLLCLGFSWSLFERTDHVFLLAASFFVYFSLLLLFSDLFQLRFSGKSSLIFTRLKRIIQIVFYLLIAGLSASFASSLSYPVTQISYPAPLDNSAHGFTLSDLEILYENSVSDTFINVSDMLVHFAFQQGFMYNAPYKVPSSAEPLVLPRYKVESGKISSWNETLLEYDQIWLIESLAAIGKYGPGSVMLSQGVPVRFKSKTDSGNNRQISVKQLMEKVSVLLFLNYLGFNSDKNLP